MWSSTFIPCIISVQSVYFRCIFSVFPVYFTYISRVFPVYFRCITDVKSMYTSVFITCNIKVHVYMVVNVYMTCVRNNDALIAGWEQDLNRRTSASGSDTLPTELSRLGYLTITYTVLISCT